MKNKPSYIPGCTLLSYTYTTTVTHFLNTLLEVFFSIYKHYDYINMYMNMYMCIYIYICIYMLDNLHVNKLDNCDTHSSYTVIKDTV